MKTPLPQPGFHVALSLLTLSLFASPASARLVGAVTDFDGQDSTWKLVPTRISQTGLYDNAASKARKMTAGIVPYTVNAPLWSDGAHKERFVQVPAGKKIVPTDSDYYSFPDKTVFIKNFAIDTVYGDSATRILVETRFLIVRTPVYGNDPDVHGLSYRWQRNQSDAVLVDENLGLDTLHMVKWGGKAVGKRWHYPNESECQECHQGRGVLGFITPQLNNGAQFQALAAAGVLTANPLAGKTNTFRWYAVADKTPGVTLEMKARSYFASNCSHCHSQGSDLMGCNHSFDYFGTGGNIRNADSGGYVDKPTGNGGDAYPRVIYSAHPESSYVMHRITTKGSMIPNGAGYITNPDPFGAQMPPLATYQIDSSAVTVIKDWICSLTAPGAAKSAAACKMPPVEADASFWDESFPLAVYPHAFARPNGLHAFLRGKTVVVTGKRVSGEALLCDFRGRRVPLIRIREGEYALGAPLHAGGYLLRVGREFAWINVLP